MTLFTALRTLALVAAPFVPFMSESMYQNIVRTVDQDAPLSVHLCDYPACDESLIDAALEEHMERVLDIVTLGRSARSDAAIKIRQPLPCLHVQGAPLAEGFARIIADELNVKRVDFLDDAASLIAYEVKPQLRTLGPRYGRLLGAISRHLAADGVGDAVVAATRGGGVYRATVDGTQIELSEADVLVSTRQKAGLVSASDHGLTVVLDTNLTPALVEEGFVRELVSKVQTMRREAGFEVADHIVLSWQGGPRIAAIFERYGADILAGVLGDSLAAGAPDGFVKDWDINGEPVTLGVRRV